MCLKYLFPLSLKGLINLCSSNLSMALRVHCVSEKIRNSKLAAALWKCHDLRGLQSASTSNLGVFIKHMGCIFGKVKAEEFMTWFNIRLPVQMRSNLWVCFPDFGMWYQGEAFVYTNRSLFHFWPQLLATIYYLDLWNSLDKVLLLYFAPKYFPNSLCCATDCRNLHFVVLIHYQLKILLVIEIYLMEISHKLHINFIKK